MWTGLKTENNIAALAVLFRAVTHPSLLNWWRRKSLAASLMAFSGVTRVRFTAAPATTSIDQLTSNETYNYSYRKMSVKEINSTSQRLSMR